MDGGKAGDESEDMKTAVENDNYDGPISGHGDDEADADRSDLESSFFYSQHPLVVSTPS